jgi:coenzyme F420-reducing hydrogenase delta subunit
MDWPGTSFHIRIKSLKMLQHVIPDILVYLCKNSVPEAGSLPVQWTEAGVHIQTKVIPCSGKIDAQYILHSLEGGVRGVCVMTCPHGECTLSQGNYRAEMRVKTVQRLLSEIGDDPQRAGFIQCPANATLDIIKGLISGEIRRFFGNVPAAINKQ